MNRMFAFLAAAAMTAAFSVQSARAQEWERRPDPRLTGVSIGVGAAATAGYFAINDWKWHWNNSSGLTPLAAWGMLTIGCAAVSPMVGTVVLNRPLTNREAGVLIASCVVPIVGGWLVNAAYDQHPEWEAQAKPVRAVAVRKHRRMR
jgi:hypothetical protein